MGFAVDLTTAAVRVTLVVLDVVNADVKRWCFMTVVKEGAAIVAFKLVTLGTFDEEGVTQLLKAPGERGDPACSGTRNLQDNLSDLRAQVRPCPDRFGLVFSFPLETCLLWL